MRVLTLCMAGGNVQVCMLAGGHPVLDRRVFHKEAQSLAKDGYSVLIIGQATGSVPATQSGVRLQCIPAWPRVPVLGFLHRVYHLILQGRNVQTDVYHAHDPESIVAGLMLKKLTGRKLVYDVHEILAEPPHNAASWIWFPLLFILQWLVCRHADLVVATTDAFADHVRRVGARCVITVENFVQLDVVRRPKSIKRSAVGLSQDAFVLGYFGHMSEVMATYELVQGFIRYRDCNPRARLLLIGNIVDPRVAQAVKNNAAIIHLPFMRYDDVLSYFSLLDVGLMNFRDIPVASMPISTKLFEFMYFRIPVITGDSLQQNVRIIRREKCGYSAGWNHFDAWADRMDELARHPRLRKDMGLRGRKAVLKKYHWGFAEKRLVGAYRRMLHG